MAKLELVGKSGNPGMSNCQSVIVKWAGEAFSCVWMITLGSITKHLDEKRVRINCNMLACLYLPHHGIWPQRGWATASLLPECGAKGHREYWIRKPPQRSNQILFNMWSMCPVGFQNCYKTVITLCLLFFRESVCRNYPGLHHYCMLCATSDNLCF